MLKKVLERIISTWPTDRKAKLLDLTLPHISEVCYLRLEKQGFRPNGIIDIGAYQGDWTRLIKKIFQQVPILMIEARSEQKSFLEQTCAELVSAQYALCLLGNAEAASVTFHVMASGSSIYSERSNVPRSSRHLTMHTLDNLLKQYRDLQRPLFIKLDVQGAELDVLCGAEDTLRQAEVVQLEVALMNYNEGAPTANVVFDFMADRDFLLFDICGFGRPSGNLVQIDALFVHKDSKLRQDYFTFG